ncbi:MAG: hypothetical protein QOF62_1559 [Pyrinomonadaceae bacterium]|jgi:hypothetical protein|nr:hypothetical protein [Pyrinomonadaceae bacterium]
MRSQLRNLAPWKLFLVTLIVLGANLKRGRVAGALRY